MPLMIKSTSIRCLDCNAEVSAEMLRLMKSTFGRDEQVFFSFLLNMNTKTWHNISVHYKNPTIKNMNRPLQPVLTSNDQY